MFTKSSDKIGHILPTSFELPMVSQLKSNGINLVEFQDDAYQHLNVSFSKFSRQAGRDIDLFGLEKRCIQWAKDNDIKYLIAGHSFAAFIKAAVCEKLGINSCKFAAIATCNNKYLARCYAKDGNFFMGLDHR